MKNNTELNILVVDDHLTSFLVYEDILKRYTPSLHFIPSFSSRIVEVLQVGIDDYLTKQELSPEMLYKSIIYNIEKKRNLAQLQESEKQYQHLFHISPEPMWIGDVDQGKFLDINYAAIKQYGYSLDEFKQMTVKDLRPLYMQTNFDEVLSKIKKSSCNSQYKGVFIHQKKNGELIYVEICTNPFIFNKQKARLVLAHNITEKINYIKEIEDQNNKLKNIAWTQSHVVRAPLARIKGIIALIDLLHQKELNHDLAELFTYLLESSNQMDEIIRKIISNTDLTKLNSNTTTVINEKTN